MKVMFLGGASGIGASCIAIQTGESWILVDAGIRMDPNADRLPDLSALQDKPVAAIFVTHAHADHIGALPLVYQEFPTVPIYASRATMLLMEVMLNDALQVMAKRATTENEVPLYDESLVNSTLHRLCPLPLTGTLTVAELPEVVVHTSRAGHVAGAISIGFEAPDGRVLISGDVSVTPQHTVPGAQLSSLRHPDLYILESTYGARLHPNRQTEEERLAQAVAEGIQRGGHVLIPAFALGRAQEVIRILHMAQRRGTIPEFLIWVDGLVRRVCSTYTAIPNALTPALQRQIQRGYPVFYSGMVRQVMDTRQRERVLQGSPSCIISSSGMLTGGPSAYYARHIAEQSESSILITGYQDDEAPGRRLLALADQQGGTLDLGEHTVTVRCHFDRYHLSAHADGNELTALVSTLKPRRVALVHGDPESRVALAQRMERLSSVELPSDGQVMEIETSSKQRTSRRADKATAEDINLRTAAPPLTSSELERLWRATQDGSGTQMVSVRELALTWYGTMAGEEEEAQVREVLDQECQQAEQSDLFFVPVPDLPGLYRVRAPASDDEQPQESSRAVQPGMLLLIQLFGEKVSPGVCFDVRSDALWVYLPTGDSNRTRFPRSAVLEVIGKWNAYPITSIPETRQSLADMMKSALRWQRQHPPRYFVHQMEPEQTYEFEEVAALASVEPDDPIGNLAVALLLNTTPRLFVRQHDAATAFRKPHYALHPDWQTALEEGAGDVRPDQMWILSVVDQHLGDPPDLYRKSINPDTGEVTLSFHFPAVAREHYREALAKAAEEAGVTITIAPQPHQGALTEVAHRVLPEGVSISKTSLHHDRDMLRLRYGGPMSQAEREQAIRQFHEQTGWTLELESDSSPSPRKGAAPAIRQAAVGEKKLDLHTAMALTRATLKKDTGFYKVSADQSSATLTVRFHFPDVARQRYDSLLAELSEKTGWNVTVYPELHQGAMEGLVRRLMPATVELVGAPSLYRKNQQVIAKVRGAIDADTLERVKAQFAQESGWTLDVQQV